MINTALLCLGSNTTDRENRISNACKQLCAKTFIKRHSDRIESEDISGIGASYINQTIEISTPLALDELRSLIHLIEQNEGRTAKSKSSGKMPLDIDIVVWNDKIISPTNYSRPYFQQSLQSLK